TVLVTGGTGALGGHVARWLAGQGAEHLLLVSRRGSQAPGADDLAAELSALGAKVTVAACDIADRAALAALLDGIPAEHPLTAVFHTAAVLDDGVLDSLTVEQMARVARVKADAALHLDELTRSRDLDAFVLFSALAGTFAASGQGNYAPGNAFLDALAEQRRHDGFAATSIAWGVWGGAGMADGTAVGEVARRHGIPAMDPDLAVAAMKQALDRDETFLAIADIDWPRFAVAYTATRPSAFLGELPEVREITAGAGRDEQATGAAEALLERLAGKSAEEQVRLLADLVRDHVAAVLGHGSADSIDRKRAFKDLGFDSVVAVELRNRLTAATGLRLPASLVFDYPTSVRLAEHLHRGLVRQEDDGALEERALAQVSGVEELLARTAAHEDVHATVLAQLEEVLERYRSAGRPAERPDLGAATADQLFAMLNRDFGKS
ncbi:SDR family NAD(P)-dependent oxidoreductase, partial [Kitasatospora sp. NPDC093806]|uniref:type I polyketide synthase n=1 Tax=Kitasatospora sp. NPDC093806 TaxID=3155075 RepID=UPI003444C6C1